ncbi:MAG: SPASM domain-containing protein, partial [Desulfuromonadales bacterium]|nr:SPASM domain-containing protein [Desulfuromonadales bacterium]
TQSGLELQISCVLNRYNIDSAHLLLDHFYPQVKRFHFLNIQRTRLTLENPDLLVSDAEAHNYWRHLRQHSKQFPDDLFLPSLRIMMRSYGEEGSHDSQTLHQQATFDCSSCSVGLTKVEIDAKFNVLGCDIAKDFSYMGNVRHNSFEEVWRSAEAEKVRNFPYPPCYQIRSPDGTSLADQLKPEYQKAL